jgi:hypothetical protein
MTHPLPQRGQAATKQEKNFWYPDFTNRPDQTNGLNPGDSANPDTTKSFCFFCKDCTCNRLLLKFSILAV